MSKAATHSFELSRTESSAPTIDKYAIVPILACAFATIIGPLIGRVDTSSHIVNAEPGLANRIFWPAMAAVSLAFAMRNYSRLGRLTWPPHLICLLAYVAFAGASVLWAFRPEASLVRFAQQIMILSSIILPAMLAARTADLMWGVFVCFAVGTILNVFFVFENPPSIDGYPGYFLGKNYLGEFSAVALLLALYETRQSGLRRVFGIIIMVVATLLLLWSNSKTALGLAFAVPCLARLTLMTARSMRISPAILLLSIPVGYAVLSSVSGFNMNRVSYLLYGDSTFTGRTIIWDFADYEIARKPLLGWGYQSFWLVGPGAPGLVEAPGWTKNMPNAHNGYIDTTLEMGYVGYYLLVIFIIATLHAIGRLAYLDAARARLLLSLALYIICYNYLESLWMRGYEFLWVMFLIVAAESGRYWQPFPPTMTASGARPPRPSGNNASRGAMRPVLTAGSRAARSQQ
jgi:exopolysaccharide production protein ExoQ